MLAVARVLCLIFHNQIQIRKVEGREIRDSMYFAYKFFRQGRVIPSFER